MHVRLIPPVYAPEPSGWHHRQGVDPLPAIREDALTDKEHVQTATVSS
jgi:hypothetical protein